MKCLLCNIYNTRADTCARLLALLSWLDPLGSSIDVWAQETFWICDFNWLGGVFFDQGIFSWLPEPESGCVIYMTRDGAGPCWRLWEGNRALPPGNVCDHPLGHTAIRLSLKFQPCGFHRTRIMPWNCAVESDIFISQQFMSSLSQSKTNLKTQYKANTAQRCSDRISPGSKRCDLPHPFPSGLG